MDAEALRTVPGVFLISVGSWCCYYCYCCYYLAHSVFNESSIVRHSVFLSSCCYKQRQSFEEILTQVAGCLCGEGFWTPPSALCRLLCSRNACPSAPQAVWHIPSLLQPDLPLLPERPARHAGDQHRAPTPRLRGHGLPAASDEQ